MQPVQITRPKRSTKYEHDVEGGDDNNDIPTVSVNSHSTPTHKLFEYFIPFMVQDSPVGQGFLFIEATRSHLVKTSHIR